MSWWNDWDKALRNKIWEKQVLKILENWCKICGWVQAAKLVVQLTFAAPSQFDYAGNQPTNQRQSLFLRKIFIASLLLAAIQQTTADFRQLPSCFSFLQIQLKHMETPFHVPAAKTRQNKIHWTEESNNCPLTHKLFHLTRLIDIIQTDDDGHMLESFCL